MSPRSECSCVRRTWHARKFSRVELQFNCSLSCKLLQLSVAFILGRAWKSLCNQPNRYKFIVNGMNEAEKYLENCMANRSDYSQWTCRIRLKIHDEYRGFVICRLTGANEHIRRFHHSWKIRRNYDVCSVRSTFFNDNFDTAIRVVLLNSSMLQYDRQGWNNLDKRSIHNQSAYTKHSYVWTHRVGSSDSNTGWWERITFD